MVKPSNYISRHFFTLSGSEQHCYNPLLMTAAWYVHIISRCWIHQGAHQHPQRCPPGRMKITSETSASLVIMTTFLVHWKWTRRFLFLCPGGLYTTLYRFMPFFTTHLFASAVIFPTALFWKTVLLFFLCPWGLHTTLYRFMLLFTTHLFTSVVKLLNCTSAV